MKDVSELKARIKNLEKHIIYYCSSYSFEEGRHIVGALRDRKEALEKELKNHLTNPDY